MRKCNIIKSPATISPQWNGVLRIMLLLCYVEKTIYIGPVSGLAAHY
jgi:hypothetical protein